ncbi:MAG: hypothetical protein H6710_15670 [Myxococcales bacterium]|nr:hypothetical protein [Myxococcales bacterium]
MEVLVRLLMQMREASEEFKQRHRGGEVLDLFKRFFREEEPRYNCLLGLLTASGCVDDDLAPDGTEADALARWQRIARFLGRLETVLLRHSDYFNRVFRHAVVALTTPVLTDGSSRDDMLKRMSSTIQSQAGSKFQHLVVSLRMHMQNDDVIIDTPIEFGEALERPLTPAPKASRRR